MSLFASAEMAAGYAKARPPVHARILERANLKRAARALDVGSGAGVSTQALSAYAHQCIGVEPVAAMAHSVCAAAEALPFADQTFALATAAGSLNYVSDLDASFAEVARVLRPGAWFVVYDFSAGKRFADGDPTLSEWFAQFQARYPNPPAGSARVLDPGRLAHLCGPRFRPAHSEILEIVLELSPGFYLNYMLTETNVAYAVEQGAASLSEIRDWCAATLWRGAPRKVAFDGYYACFVRLP
ncbi:methyltransferase domain-containing protein [Aetokthonos hydrillicola Thurmond2011]|uniref:Methyltransferase domain-containing protein n=1 Tax=Aetokthonos hydrillicola Thurmond2011 TaxID=2712845 RepID=A0AAP5IGW2_9CYAN|nr:methyltransferase domain-containing protein [Aetokthonos hydrillicola]MDR9900967.1 methyltransferase domain-containing protein [Aetokthonos hydrillicola Thurmond2011]